ncbi:bifunctional 2-C-methyl-D-erythritol 4-phosphate cytidylyltransferase/2-C-methyl-D-erythritol 2,4-cyclodiphosphate synthase [Helicobacter sp. 11S02596-1]|uniref:bifunctional 2-C-methyl-D-erythritol 4-phosphate cytidylyltransferase/2-C-methyl-D-erythritol 2,4-cyclodiphosphate synthase n=1 Tax=Helicobacter sp. 11S02596-1 TaxID=1476194 RepID=UPI000BA547D4|nr:bifunctional 2-C-methyl-D-erythritol 4-phosphate cytidylyltransferase/2-C-methyl-D-erythritol 2,4-cyclodiphosphate synthase [Helicobacter sp. 11S02596-1]PAF45113.1 bifunctional 2-C-methyl-D-erythritol 4-phosphate cytidylyltransferase/2-C-methyl-D-erythritol 2,4-cyclodiphosphate synthase [Helicobacter sp. 11S02596-1]
MKNKPEISLIITAAGASSRFSSDMPPHRRIKKQWLRLGAMPLWQKVADDFKKLTDFKQIILAVSKQDFTYMQNSYDYTFVCGGQSRQESVQNALEYIQTPLVLISDVARWNLDKNVLENLLLAWNEEIDCVAPYLEVPDTAVYEGQTIKRDALKRIQTPQLCNTQTLKNALSIGEFTDESSAIAANGGKVAYIKGSHKLAKLTNENDLFSAKDLPAPSEEIFVGSGFDVHSFEMGKKMVLGGVPIASDFGFKAHSDGDVLLHALSDAILGAIGGGDIGEWFPDTEEAHKNADSRLLLKQIYDFAISVGFELINADITIFAQTPKIAPYKQAIRQSVAELLYTDKSRVNIKATTTEHLGFIGRKEGLGVSANVHMKFINWKENIWIS